MCVWMIQGPGSGEGLSQRGGDFGEAAPPEHRSVPGRCHHQSASHAGHGVSPRW